MGKSRPADTTLTFRCRKVMQPRNARPEPRQVVGYASVTFRNMSGTVRATRIARGSSEKRLDIAALSS